MCVCVEEREGEKEREFLQLDSLSILLHTYLHFPWPRGGLFLSFSVSLQRSKMVLVRIRTVCSTLFISQEAGDMMETLKKKEEEKSRVEYIQSS